MPYAREFGTASVPRLSVGKGGEVERSGTDGDGSSANDVWEQKARERKRQKILAQTGNVPHAGQEFAPSSLPDNVSHIRNMEVLLLVFKTICEITAYSWKAEG